jgi:hypothetical protein
MLPNHQRRTLDHWQVARRESISANPIGDRRFEGEPELVADDVLTHEA